MNDGKAHTARRARSTLAAAVAALLIALPSAQAHAIGLDALEVASGGSADIGSQSLFDSQVDVGFFVAVVKDGVDSYPQTEEELQEILTGVYSPGIYIDDAFDASDFAEFGGELYHGELYDLSGASIADRIVRMPTDEEIAEACGRGGIEFDPETQTVVWYVVKSAASTWDTVWHIDGLLVPKDIAPDPEPEPDPDPDPEPEPDPDPDPDPDPEPEPEPEPNPDPEPDVPDGSDSEAGSNCEESDSSNDGGVDGTQGGEGLQNTTSTESDALDGVAAFVGGVVGDMPTASAQVLDESDEQAKPSLGSAESQDEAITEERLDSHDTPLGGFSSMSAPGEEGFSSGILSEAAATALHVVGAVGLAGVTLGVVASNVALAQMGQGLSSLDSRLRKRGGGRRR